MIRRLRFAIGAIWVATLIAVAVVATSVSGGSPAAAGPRRVVVEPAPADAGTIRPLDTSSLPPVTDSTTTAPPATLSPVTPAPPPITTAPPATAPPTTRAPQPVPTTASRAAVVAPRPTTPPTTVPAARGSSADFTTIGYRWNPCQVITVTSSGGPDIAAIVSELASITGLHLQLVSGPAEITVIWGAVPAGTGEIGLTAWKAVGRFLIESGVVISPQAQPYLATVLRHELAHAMGLGHASRSDEVMYGTVGNYSPTDYQAGDLAGLRSVGASAGC